MRRQAVNYDISEAIFNTKPSCSSPARPSCAVNVLLTFLTVSVLTQPTELCCPVLKVRRVRVRSVIIINDPSNSKSSMENLRRWYEVNACKIYYSIKVVYLCFSHISCVGVGSSIETSNFAATGQICWEIDLRIWSDNLKPHTQFWDSCSVLLLLRCWWIYCATIIGWWPCSWRWWIIIDEESISKYVLQYLHRSCIAYATSDLDDRDFWCTQCVCWSQMHWRRRKWRRKANGSCNSSVWKSMKLIWNIK